MKTTEKVMAAGAGVGRAGVGHVEGTIAEVSFRIAQLQDLMKGLHLLREWTRNGGGLPGAAANVQKHPEGWTPNSEREPAKAGTPNAGDTLKRELQTRRVQASGRAAVPNGIGGKVTGVIAGMAGQEFDAKRVWAELPGEDYGSVNSALRYMGQQGRIVVVRAGRPNNPAVYRLSKGTGTTTTEGRKEKKGKAEHAEAWTPNPEGKTKPSGAELAELQEELEKACKARDEDRGKGREALAQVWQQKVDRLVKQIKGR